MIPSCFQPWSKTRRVFFISISAAKKPRAAPITSSTIAANARARPWKSMPTNHSHSTHAKTIPQPTAMQMRNRGRRMGTATVSPAVSMWRFLRISAASTASTRPAAQKAAR